VSTTVNRKDKTTALILGIFLGGLGVHYFYLARPGMGVARIFASLFVLLPILGQIWLVLGVLPWHIYDIIRIANGTLKPGDGSEFG
jgi:TM2 domain-containing membrane protein YozV